MTSPPIERQHSIATRLPHKFAQVTLDLAKSAGVPAKLRKQINRAYGKSNKQKLRDVAKRAGK